MYDIIYNKVKKEIIIVLFCGPYWKNNVEGKLLHKKENVFIVINGRLEDTKCVLECTSTHFTKITYTDGPLSASPTSVSSCAELRLSPGLWSSFCSQ